LPPSVSAPRFDAEEHCPWIQVLDCFLSHNCIDYNRILWDADCRYNGVPILKANVLSRSAVTAMATI